MTLVYVSQSNISKVKGSLSSEKPYTFVSPTVTDVNFQATKVIVCGNYPSIEKRYKGICAVEKIEIEEDKKEE